MIGRYQGQGLLGGVVFPGSPVRSGSLAPSASANKSQIWKREDIVDGIAFRRQTVFSSSFLTEHTGVLLLFCCLPSTLLSNDST